MSRRYRDWVRANSRVSGSARAVLNILADYASDKPGREGVAWPGNEALAKESGKSERTVIRCLHTLIAEGAIELVSGGNGRGDVNHYRVLATTERVTDCHVSETVKGDNVTKKGDILSKKGDNVTPPTYTRDLEPEEPEEEPRAAAPSVPEPPPKRDPFVVAYESIWGRVPANPFEAELIADWAGRVTLPGWEYGLKESAKNRATNFGYLEKILLRIEREGYEPTNASPTTAPAQVAYSLEDLCLT